MIAERNDQTSPPTSPPTDATHPPSTTHVPAGHSRNGHGNGAADASSTGTDHQPKDSTTSDPPSQPCPSHSTDQQPTPPTDLDSALSRLSLTKRRRAIQLLNLIATPLSEGFTLRDIATQQGQTPSWAEDCKAELEQLLTSPTIDDISAKYAATQTELARLLAQPER